MNHASLALLTALSLLLLLGASGQAQQQLPPPPFIIADNNPVVLPAGRTSGTVTLEWNGGKDHPYAEVWVRVDENDETFIVEQGKGIRNVKVEFGKSYEFKLSDSNVLLASVKVTVRHKATADEETSQAGVTPSSVPAPSPDYSVSDNTSSVTATNVNAPKVAPSDYAGCWTFAGKGSFARAGLGCFQQEGDRVSFDDPTFEGMVVGNILRFKLKSGITNTPYAFRSGRFQMQRGGKQFIGSVNASLNPDDNEYPVTATLDKSSEISDFAGCWTFAGKGAFARSGLGCFRQEGDRVSFDDPVFEGIVVGKTLRFKLKSGITSTAYAFRSGRFVMNKGGKKFIGSVNARLNPDDNDYPVTATLDRSFKKKTRTNL